MVLSLPKGQIRVLGPDQPGKHLIGFTVHEKIGIVVYNPMLFHVRGCLRVYDDHSLEMLGLNLPGCLWIEESWEWDGVLPEEEILPMYY